MVSYLLFIMVCIYLNFIGVFANYYAEEICDQTFYTYYDNIEEDRTQKFFSTLKGSEMDVLKFLVRDENFSELNRWETELIQRGEYIFFPFVLMLAIDERNFARANKLLNKFEEKYVDFYVFFGSTSIPVYLHSIRMEKPLLFDVEEFERFAAKVTKKWHSTRKHHYKVEPIEDAINGHCGTDEKLIEVSKNGQYMTLYMFLINCQSELSADEYDTKLARIHLHRHTGFRKSFPKIFHKMKVPLLVDHNSRPRSQVYSYHDQEDRAKMLDHIKLNGSQHDQKIYSEIYGKFGASTGRSKMTIYEALSSGHPELVENYFLRPNLGEYLSDWIIHAIKFSTIDCLEVLLEERVPLPSTAELERAYSKISPEEASVVAELIEHFEYLYYEDGICIYGPIGCNPRKFADTNNTVNDSWIQNECSPLLIE